MSDLNDKIEVGFYGALNSGGRILLAKPATIRSGLDAVGGLAKAKATMWPAGTMRVRRAVNGRRTQIRQFDMADTTREWERFELQAGDSVIFQWHVEVSDEAEPGAPPNRRPARRQAVRAPRKGGGR